MSNLADPVTITVSRSVLTDISRLTASFTDRLHELLEKNTDAGLTPVEKGELETLVRMAEVGQIISTALQPASAP